MRRGQIHLDLGLTLEYLETKGVPVVGYQTDRLPAFYTRSSPFPVDYRLDSPVEIAAAIHAKLACGLKGGMLIVNPIPRVSMPEEVISATLTGPFRTRRTGREGQDITPSSWTGKDLDPGSPWKQHSAGASQCQAGAHIARELCRKLNKAAFMPCKNAGGATAPGVLHGFIFKSLC